jgi:hypothetical protein
MPLVVEEPDEKNETKHRYDEPSLHRVEISQNGCGSNYRQYVADGINGRLAVKSSHPTESRFADTNNVLHRLPPGERNQIVRDDWGSKNAFKDENPEMG